MTRLVMAGLAAVGAAIALGVALWAGGSSAPEVAEITMPDLSAEVKVGKAQFNANCAACHGSGGTGTDQGPPLIHVIYEPSHHGDMSFLRAAQNGVRAHHWPFGDMPPVPGVTQADALAIVAYIREIQRANGIH